MDTLLSVGMYIGKSAVLIYVCMYMCMAAWVYMYIYIHALYTRIHIQYTNTYIAIYICTSTPAVRVDKYNTCYWRHVNTTMCIYIYTT